MNSKLLSLLLLSLVTLVGCQTRLSDERTYTIDSVDVQTMIVDAIPRERNLQVAAAADNPVSVYVYLEEDKDEVVPKIDVDMVSDTLLACAKEKNQIDLSAIIPANKTVMIDIKTKTDGTTVTVKLSD